MSEIPEVIAYASYEWDCDCGLDNHVDHDPSGEILTCEECGQDTRIWESR